MNPSPDPTNPLLQSLADEAADLPLLAASEARRRHARRQRNQLSIPLAVLALAIGLGAWQVRTMRPVIPTIVAVPPMPTESSPTPAPGPREYVKVQTEEQARSHPLPLPPGLSREQQNVVEAARGLPLLLVRDRAGKVTRIHVIER